MLSVCDLHSLWAIALSITWEFRFPGNSAQLHCCWFTKKTVFFRTRQKKFLVLKKQMVADEPSSRHAAHTALFLFRCCVFFLLKSFIVWFYLNECERQKPKNSNWHSALKPKRNCKIVIFNSSNGIIPIFIFIGNWII